MINNLLFSVFFLAGMIGLIVSVIIICKKENLIQNALLSLCLFVLSCSCIYSLYIHSGSIFFYPKGTLAVKSLAFFVAPCAYLYTKKVINPSFRFKWYHWLNFLPFVMSLIYTTGNTTKILNSDFWIFNNPFFNIDYYSFNITVNIIWLLYAYTQVLMIFRDSEKTTRLSAEKNRWVKAFSFFTMLLFVSLLMQKIVGVTYTVNANAINSSIISLTLLGAGYIVFFKPSVFFEVAKPETTSFNSIEVVEEVCYEESDLCKISAPAFLSEEKLQDYSLQIEKALIDKPFLKKGFVIRDLSELTNIPVHHLSHFINSQYNLHFQDFINKKRIEYLIQQLDDSEWKSLSLEGQAWAVGFKSRTTFFRAFTKLMGKSPSEYLNSLTENKPKGYSATA